MKRIVCLFFVLIACRAEIIDRVAVVVGNHVITESEILREIRLTAFLNGEPVDFSAASKRKTAERLVEQRLVADEISANLFPPAPAEAEQQMLKQIQERFPAQAQYREELQRAGITPEELKAHLARQLTTLRFLDFRFRPGIQVNEAETARYFNERVAPALKKSHPGATFSVNDYRSQVQEALIGEGVDKASEVWLKEAHTRTHIEFRSEVFTEPPKQEASK